MAAKQSKLSDFEMCAFVAAYLKHGCSRGAAYVAVFEEKAKTLARSTIFKNAATITDTQEFIDELEKQMQDTSDEMSDDYYKSIIKATISNLVGMQTDDKASLRERKEAADSTIIAVQTSMNLFGDVKKQPNEVKLKFVV